IDFGGGLATTEVACPDRVSATAEHVDAVLSGDATWSITNAELTVNKPGAGTLVYKAVPDETRSTDPKDLIGSDWTLTTIEQGSAASSAPGVVFTFGADAVSDSADNAAGVRI